MDAVQLLTPEGVRLSNPDYPCDLSHEQLRDLYLDLAIVRRLDGAATALQRQGELGLWASLLGQEAAQIGSARAMAAQDMAFPTYREHGVLWCRGVDPLAPLSMFRGVDHGAWDPAKHRCHMYTIVIGAQTLHATGYAMGIQRDGAVGDDNGEAVIVYFGDGATSQGDVAEAFVWSAVNQAPLVFFCQNNQYAISEPVDRQARSPIYRRAEGYGFPGVRVDGNDVLACYAVTRKALDRARHGEGPMLIEAFTYRMGAHTTSDDPTRYRMASEVEEWKHKDPVARVRAYLSREGIGDESFFEAIDAEADEQATELRARLLAIADPPPLSMFDHVYATGSPLLDEQRAEFAEYLASFEEAS